MSLLENAKKDLGKLKSTFESRKGHIGSYGITSKTQEKDNQISFHIDERDEGYQVRVEYSGVLDTSKLLEK